MGQFFGIDVGTSFLKAAVLDLDTGTVRNVERLPTPPFIDGLPSGHREVDANEVVNAVESLLARLPDRCDGLVLCGQMQGFVLVNDRGEAISNYVSWLDRRVSREQFDAIRGCLTAAELDDLGNELRPGLALPLLWWLKPLRGTPLSLPDYVAGRLCGVVPVMEPTQAAAFGALSLSRLAWHREAIGKLGLDHLCWPDVRPPGALVGHWRGVPCYAATGDQQGALAGCLLEPGELSVNIGTGSQVSSIADSPRPDGAQIRPYYDGRFLRTITHIPGGRALRALVGLLTELGGVSEEDAWPRIEAALAATPSTDLRAAVSFWEGPCGSTGFLENLHEANLSVGHVFRAVLKSMASNYASCAGRLNMEFVGGAVFSGGVARRLPLLRDLTAAALGLPYRVAGHEEDTLYGLLVLARRYSGS